MRVRQFSFLLSAVVLLLTWAQPARSQSGKLIVRANPPQAYIYVDDQPVVDSKGHLVCLTPGNHKVDIYNYGYKPETRNVTITAHKTTVLDVTMQAVPGGVSGPWGCITLEGADRSAVLLNGKDPSVFFVGHGDEFNNDFVWKQELIVPPGKYELTLACNCGDPVNHRRCSRQPARGRRRLQRCAQDCALVARRTIAKHGAI